MASLGANTIAILIALGSFPVSLALTRFFMYWNSAHGIIGIDVHKLNRPKVPEMVGVAVPITLVLFAAIYAITEGASAIPLLAYSLVVGLAALVGAVDDRLKLGGIFKPLLTLLCGLPILLLGLMFHGQIYNSTLHVPLFGGYHLPVIYPLTILVAVSVTSNAVNMLDPLNGSMDVGQLSIGASIGALAILGKTEIASIVAIFPNIQNSFFFLSRIRRFTEHRELTSKPTKLLPDGKLADSEDPRAPLTLVRTLLIGRPATENEIVSTIWMLFLTSTSLAVITLLLTGV